MYSNSAFRALALKKDAFDKLRRQPRAGLYFFLSFSALLTLLFIPLVALVVNLNMLFGGGGALTAILPESLVGLLITLFVIYFMITAALALFFVYALHLFSRVLGGKARFAEMLAAWSPALLPLCLLLLPLFTVLVYGFFGGNMSDGTGTAIGILFNVMLVALPLFSLLYTVFVVRAVAKLSRGKAAAATAAATFLFLMLGSGAYLLLAWLV